MKVQTWGTHAVCICRYDNSYYTVVKKKLYFSLPSLLFPLIPLAARYGGSCDKGSVQMERTLTFGAECIDFVEEIGSFFALRLCLHVAETAASLGILTMWLMTS